MKEQETLYCMINNAGDLISYNPADCEYYTVANRYKQLKIWDYCTKQDIETWFAGQRQPPFEFRWKKIDSRVALRNGLKY